MPTARKPKIEPLEVTLETQTPKKGSIRFETTERPRPFTNLYLGKDGHEALGRPPKIRVTVEGVWDE